MKLKRGAGGKPQYYDRHGRYCKQSDNPIIGELRKKPKWQNKLSYEETIIKSKNKEYVMDVFNILKEICPNKIQHAHKTYYNKNGTKWGEIDLETNNVVIEVKGKNAYDHLRQFIKEQQYSINKNKSFFVFAPGMHWATRRDLEKNKIEVIQDFDSLRNKIIELHNKKRRN